MDANGFDRLTKGLAIAGARRGVVRLLLTLPLGVLLTTLVGETPETTAKDNHHGNSRRRRHRLAGRRHGNAKKKKKKTTQKGKKQGCTPQPTTTTCAGKCGTVGNNCGQLIDCGSVCPQCQSCSPQTSRCVPSADDTPCDDGNACTQTDTCQGGVCVGADPVVCPPPVNPCEVSTCDPDTGNCITSTVPNRTVCAGTGNTTSVCCNGTCWDGCCGSDGSTASCQVFITSSVHTGALGGLSGADGICRARANAAGRPGTYKAWLSTVGAGGESPSTRFRQSAQPYVRVDGTQVAANWANLTTCDSSDPFACTDINIDVTETGSAFGTIQFAWTNTNSDGTPATTDEGFNCANWTKNFDGGDVGNVLFGVLGSSESTTSSWTNFGTGFCPEAENSGVGKHLYCFQQD